MKTLKALLKTIGVIVAGLGAIAGFIGFCYVLGFIHKTYVPICITERYYTHPRDVVLIGLIDVGMICIFAIVIAFIIKIFSEFHQKS